jgi:ferredoxin-fold anticodon binding domain-containing protein
MRLWSQGPLQSPIQNVTIIFSLDVDEKVFMDCLIALLKAVAIKEVEEGTTDFL